jgi:hypothetical protein
MGEKNNNIESKQINQDTTGLVRLDKELIRLLKIKAATEKTTIKALIEGEVASILEVKSET